LLAEACHNSSTPQQGAANPPAVDKAPFQDIDGILFKQKMKEPNTVIIDVRTPEETREGIIEGAVEMDITQDNFMEKIGELDNGKTYLVYCQSGGRSSRACSMMAEAGFKSLYNLKGGYSNWQE